MDTILYNYKFLNVKVMSVTDMQKWFCHLLWVHNFICFFILIIPFSFSHDVMLTISYYVLSENFLFFFFRDIIYCGIWETVTFKELCVDEKKFHILTSILSKKGFWPLSLFLSMTLATLALSSFLSAVSSKAIMRKKVLFEGVLPLWAFYKRALWAFYTRKKKE